MFRIVRGRVRARRMARRLISHCDRRSRTVVERKPARPRMPMILPSIALGLVAAAVVYRFQLGLADAVWSAVSSPYLSSLWTGLLLTVCVCGTVSYGVVEWACRRPSQIVRRESAGDKGTSQSEPAVRSRQAA